MKNKFLNKATAFLIIITVAIQVTGFINKKEKYRSDYQVVIVNKNWEKMHLQVRVGNQNVPENNTLVKDVYLKKGESVTVDYDVLCYYRRDANPDKPDNVNFTTWTGAGCFRNKPCVVDNP